METWRPGVVVIGLFTPRVLSHTLRNLNLSYRRRCVRPEMQEYWRSKAYTDENRACLLHLCWWDDVSLNASFYYMLAPPLMPQQCVHSLCLGQHQKHRKRKPPTRGEREQRHTNKDSSRLSSSLVGMAGLQEDMAGPSQSDMECMKILIPGGKCLFFVC
jgi:hypothetical protein